MMWFMFFDVRSLCFRWNICKTAVFFTTPVYIPPNARKAWSLKMSAQWVLPQHGKLGGQSAQRKPSRVDCRRGVRSPFGFLHNICDMISLYHRCHPTFHPHCIIVPETLKWRCMDFLLCFCDVVVLWTWSGLVVCQERNPLNSNP